MFTRLSFAPPPPSWKTKLRALFTSVPGRYAPAQTAAGGLEAASEAGPDRRSTRHQTCMCDSQTTAPGAPQRSAAGLSPGPRLLVFLLAIYKAFVSPLLPSSCKFYPTCSSYAQEAVVRHGVARGLGLALRRLLRCRPFSDGGYDPVPDA